MNTRKKVMILGTYAAIMLVIVSCSYLLVPADNGTDDPPLTGTWHLVSKEAMDNNQFYTRSIDPKYDITVTKEYGNIFTAETQGVLFSGVHADGNIMFEYRYDDTVWIRASGNMVNGMLIMYEMHFYSDDYWFVSISKYSKDGKGMGPAPNTPAVIHEPWTLREGNSHYWLITATGGDTPGPQEYALDGGTFYISNTRGNIFRAEMEQGASGSIVTRYMNGIFTGESKNVSTALLLDESGKMWTLSILNGVVTLRAIVTSEYKSYEPMVVAERRYYDGIPHSAPDAPDMTGTWTADGATGRRGDGTDISRTDSIVTEYHNQYGYVFIGETAAASLPEAGYLTYDPTAYNGWSLRVGTDLGSGEFKDGCAFLNEDFKKMTMVLFTYDGTHNGVMIYEFVRS